MTFTYPAIVKKVGEKDYRGYFPDLAMCEFHGETVDEALDDANYAMSEWIRVELEEDEPDFPAISDPADIELSEGESVHNVMVHYRFYDGWDE